MENNKVVQTSSPIFKSNSVKRSNTKKLKSIRNYKISNNDFQNIKVNNKTKEKEGNDVINLQSGAIIGKLYKKTNDTEWAAQNRAVKEKNQSNFEVNQIIKRYNFHKGKLKYGYSNDYINLLTELLCSKKSEYSKQRLQLSKYRINLSKKHKKGYGNYLNFINNNLNNSENIKEYPNRKKEFSIISSPKQNIQLKSNELYENIYLNTLSNINENNNEEIKNKPLSLIKNKSNYYKKIENYKRNNIDSGYRDFKINNNLTFFKFLKSQNNNLDLDSQKYKNENDSNKMNLKIFNHKNKNNPKNKNMNKKIEINAINNSFDKSNSLNKNLNSFSINKNSQKNSPKKASKTIYKNERDIYFEKENEEDEFLVSGNKDQYENYLKNKFDFYEDMEDKQTQYIYEIKKRNITLFNYNKNIEMKNNHKSVINYLNKISRVKTSKNLVTSKPYKIHDIFKEKYTKSELRNMRLNFRSKKILKTLKIKFQ